jgi:hypothetical protein
MTVQTNGRFAADSRQMTTSTERMLTSCGAIEVKKRYSAYARLSLMSGTSLSESLIRITVSEGQVARHMERLGGEIVLLHLPPQRHRADVQRCRRAFAVAFIPLESATNQLPFL